MTTPHESKGRVVEIFEGYSDRDYDKMHDAAHKALRKLAEKYPTRMSPSFHALIAPPPLLYGGDVVLPYHAAYPETGDRVGIAEIQVPVESQPEALGLCSALPARSDWSWTNL